MIGRLSGPREPGFRRKYLLPIGIVDFRARATAASHGALRFFLRVDGQVLPHRPNRSDQRCAVAFDFGEVAGRIGGMRPSL